MSEPKRYTGKVEGLLLGSPHWEHPEGEWVKYEDYARLKAEVERLTAFTTRTIIPNEQLQAQVERLTKAGNAIVKDNLNWNTNHDHIKEWRDAAKEGKQP
jgi:hypothetical protein